MTHSTQLNTSALPELAARIPVPGYDRSELRTGIVHFGVGGFHRSHQAMYIDRLLQQGGAEQWGICGVGVLPSDARMRDVMMAQDNLYMLRTLAPDGRAEPRIIGSIVRYLFAPDDPAAVIETLAHPDVRIVSLTITESGYPVNDATGRFEVTHPGIQHDLASGSVPQTAFGFIVEGLRLRRSRGIAPFTVMSCDNIQGNGQVTRVAVTSFARLKFADTKDDDLGDWIASSVSFPSSMVDRITPVTTDADRAEIAERYGIEDGWPVSSESFEQWVLEDDFPYGRPPFEDAGVQLVDDVEPYELMKLRLLNASHQAMGYLGILSGFEYVHEVCRDELFTSFLLRYMIDEATPTLKPVPGIDLAEYRQQLLDRFASTAVRDTLARLVTDGAARISKFLLPVIRDQLATGGQIRLSVLVIAAYAQVQGSGNGTDLDKLLGDLGRNERFATTLTHARDSLGQLGPRATLKKFLA